MLIIIIVVENIFHLNVRVLASWEPDAFSF